MYLRAKIIRAAVISALSICFAADLQATDTLPFHNPQACMEGPLAQFGRYVGNWTIQDETLSQDGTTWTKGAGGQWNFVCLGNGTAIQDFWMPAEGEVGTNLRTYDPTTSSWKIIWAVKPQPGYSEITAQHMPNDSIVMRYKNPIPTPERRITFYPPTNEGWKWKLEFSNDEGRSWRAVYRMSAEPSS